MLHCHFQDISFFHFRVARYLADRRKRTCKKPRQVTTSQYIHELVPETKTNFTIQYLHPCLKHPAPETWVRLSCRWFLLSSSFPWAASWPASQKKIQFCKFELRSWIFNISPRAQWGAGIFTFLFSDKILPTYSEAFPFWSAIATSRFWTFTACGSRVPSSSLYTPVRGKILWALCH